LREYVDYYKKTILSKNQNRIPFHESSFQSYFSQSYQDEIQGLVDGVNSTVSSSSSSSASSVVSFGDILALQYELELAGIGCTAVGFFGNKTEDSQAIVSRSLDWEDHSEDKRFVDSQMIISSEPSESGLSKTVSFSRVGLVGYLTAFTDKGTYLEMNHSGIENVSFSEVQGRVYPHSFLMRDLLESFSSASLGNHDEIRRHIRSFVRNSYDKNLKPLPLAQYLFAHNGGSLSPYMSVIEGIGIDQIDSVVLRESSDFANKNVRYEGTSYQKSHAILSHTNAGMLLIDEESLYQVEEKNGSLHLKDLFSNKSFVSQFSFIKKQSESEFESKRIIVSVL
jgi:hypothetical protein